MHAGQKGVVEADWGNYVLVRADDESYTYASKNSGREGKYFQVDSLCLKQLKE